METLASVYCCYYDNNNYYYYYYYLLPSFNWTLQEGRHCRSFRGNHVARCTGCSSVVETSGIINIVSAARVHLGTKLTADVSYFAE